MAAPDPQLVPAGPAYLDGQPISAGVEWEITPREIRDVTQAVDGTPRETVWWHGDDQPCYRVVYEMSLDYRHLSALAAHRVESLLSRLGPYELVLWQHVYQSFLADGTARTWTLPRLHALDSLAPPAGVSAAHLAPIVCIGTADPLTVATKSAGDYAGGDPASGVAWFLEHTGEFKISAAPALGAFVTVAHVPVFSVLRAGEPIQRKSDKTLTTPRRLRFVERLS